MAARQTLPALRSTPNSFVPDILAVVAKSMSRSILNVYAKYPVERLVFSFTLSPCIRILVMLIQLEGTGCQASISYKTYFDSEQVRACCESPYLSKSSMTSAKSPLSLRYPTTFTSYWSRELALHTPWSQSRRFRPWPQ